MYACLAGLPVGTLDFSLIISALVPYFMDGITTVQISARNAAQFLIPVLDESHKRFFILSAKNVHDLINASGKSMPVISSLRFFLAYGNITANCKLFLREDIFSHAFSIMWQSSRDDEKILAVSVIQMLSIHYQEMARSGASRDYGDVASEIHNTTATAKTVIADVTNFSDILTLLVRQVLSFTASCSKTDFNHSIMKEQFESFRNLLKALDVPQLHEVSVAEDVRHGLLNIAIDLLEGNYSIIIGVLNLEFIHFSIGLISAGDNQVIRWTNLMILECWQILVTLQKKDCNCQQIFRLIDKILSLIDAFIGRKSLNEVSLFYTYIIKLWY